MEITSVNQSHNFANAQVLTSVEKNDRGRSQVKPVAAGTDSASAALGDKELHQNAGGARQKEEAMDFEAMSKIAEEIQDRLDMMGSSLGFSINQEHESLVAQISDRKSGELIKQIPSEEVLELREKMKELVGIFFNKKV